MMPDISKMTLREKIGQMFILRDDRLYNMIPNEEIAEYLKKNPIGGIWATGRLKKMATTLNFEAASGAGTLDDLKGYIKLLNSNLKIPLLVGGDSEKGGFMDSSEISGPDAVVATNDDSLAYEYGACMARELAVGGLNWRWSPISDISHHDSSISVNRVCSDDPEKVVRYSRALIKGTQDNGVAATVKHFPGHDPRETRDSHFMASINNCSLEEWLETQGKIYKESIEGGAYSVMVGHAAFPAVDDSKIGTKRRPSTFSKKVITDLLKGQFGFKGVVITDDVGMNSALTVYGRDNKGEMYVELINAGNDMLLGTPIGENREDFIGYIENAIKCGRVQEERINDACERIFDMKQKLGLFEPEKELEYSLEQAAEKTHAMNTAVARKSLTLLANDIGLLPCKAEEIKKVSIIPVTHTPVFKERLQVLKEAFEKRGIPAQIYDTVYQCNLTEAAKDGLIIYANFVSAHQPAGRCTFFGDVAQQFFKILTVGADKSVVVSFGSPFIKEEYYEETATYINAYWYNKETMEAVCEGILGELEFEGVSPFRIK